MQEYLLNHIDDSGIKNIDPFYDAFLDTCNNETYITNVRTQFENHKTAREAHIIEHYKKIGNFDLEIHLFLPDSSDINTKKPAIVYFHGGSWSQGKPDHFLV